MSARKCGVCGHDPACGYVSHWNAATNVTTWMCHDDDHSCYAPAPYVADFRTLPSKEWIDQTLRGLL